MESGKTAQRFGISVYREAGERDELNGGIIGAIGLGNGAVEGM